MRKHFFTKSWGMRKVYGKYTRRIIGQVLRDWQFPKNLNGGP